MNITQKIKPIHPFAARMAPEIAFEALSRLPKRGTVLDPMAGSGTVLRTISELGFNGIGFDVDPLSVLMSKAWTTKIDEVAFLKKSEKILKAARGIGATEVILPWIDEDAETKGFVEFWFGRKQIIDLRKLSFFINSYKSDYTPLFKIAFSRLIITKSSGASLAGDVSHSRPHKVRETNDFEVFEAFKNTCHKISKTINSEKLIGGIKVKNGDARKLKQVESASIDAIITSPPYLNALDYMRGHKMSLVWLGHKIGELSLIRGESVGAEKAPNISSDFMLAKHITRRIKNLNSLPQRKVNMVYRYALDMDSILKESYRVLKKKTNATFVIGNSSLQGVYIENTVIVEEAAKQNGFKLINCEERDIPQNKRYLPPPNNASDSSLNLRMKTECIMTLKKISK